MRDGHLRHILTVTILMVQILKTLAAEKTGLRTQEDQSLTKVFNAQTSYTKELL